MKNTVICAGLMTALMACQSDTYYAEGVSIATRDRDLASCNALAYEAHPRALVTRYRPRVFHPARQICTAPGVCTLTPPHWTGGEPYHVDVNEDERGNAAAGCMASRGYALISLPQCETNGTVAASTIMAPLGTETCLINRQGGGALVVNP